MVVYPMPAQLRLLMDAALVGEARVFGIEALSADPLFVHLAGGRGAQPGHRLQGICAASTRRQSLLSSG
jgi:hypothetical protein